MDSGYRALADANKGLCVIFIILIVVTNALVLWKHVRKTKFYFRSKNMIVISLAVGDVILALFPLIVDAVGIDYMMIFRDNCRLLLAYETYKYFLIHFVFGLGLMVLGTEILLREKVKQFFLNQMPLVAVVTSSIPWILGLLIVVPICLSKGGYFRCETIHSPETKYTVSVFVPASLALIYSIVVLCVSIQGRSGGHDEPHVDVVSQNKSSEHVRCGNIATYPLETEPRVHTEEHLYLVDQSKPTPEHHVMMQLAPELNATSSSQDPSPAYESQSNTRKEKFRLLVMAVAYFVMVIPLAAFSVSNTRDFINKDRFTFRKIVLLLKWLMVARSGVTPIIFLSFRV